MEATYSNSHHCIIIYDVVAQQMSKVKVMITDAAGQFWGKAQVVHLKLHCTGTPKITQIQHPMGQTAKHKGQILLGPSICLIFLASNCLSKRESDSHLQ
jgi:hypothetical protein